MKKVAIIIAALIALFIGVGGILPALAKVRDTGAIPSTFVGSYTQETQGGVTQRCNDEGPEED